MLTLALCVLCHDRPDDLPIALASARGFDEVVVLDMGSDPPLAPVAGARWIRCDRNEGVAAGRNRQAEIARADVLVFLDDDARFLDPDAADRIRRAFLGATTTAALAFFVQRPDGTVVAHEQPFRGGVRHADTARPCAYFVGCGAAVRRDAYRAAGGFDERFGYSTEEIDLAFGLIRDGWELAYAPSVRVEHRPSSRGRAPSSDVPALRLRNRILLARRHLPIFVAVPHLAAWGLRTLVEAGRCGGLTEWRHAWAEGLRLPVPRAPLRWRALWTAHRRGGRVLW
jgi:GT2 family glycosyltransferase